MKHLTFLGRLTSGIQWMTGRELKWPAVCNAHRHELPDIDTYEPGTLNVSLQEPQSWRPPLDEYFRLKARLRGLEIGRHNSHQGGDFLFFGNYIHPFLRVIRINQSQVDGRVYYPGTSVWNFDAEGMPTPISDKRTRLEIISKTQLRSLLEMKETDRDYDVRVVIEILPPSWLS